MDLEIEAGELAALDACDEGIDWFLAQFPAGRAAAALAVRLLEDQGRGDYLAWAFLRIPGFRSLGTPGLLPGLLGPRHADLLAFVDELAGIRWLAGGRGRRFQTAVDRHVRRLARFGFVRTATFLPTDCLPFHAALAEVPDEAALEARTTVREWVEETLADIPGVAQQVRLAAGDPVHATVFRVVREKLRRGGAVAGDDPDPFRTCTVIASQAREDAVGHALWLLADVQAPSPFEPLISLWRQGCWPAGISGGRFVLGVPDAEA
jgi:hypothetical protein